jgi:hypothetical protein
MRRYSPDALTSIVIAAECGCGDHHPQTGPNRVTLSAYAVPLAERVIDGELVFGWEHHEAGLLRLVDASTHFFTLLTELTAAPAATPARTLVGVA